MIKNIFRYIFSKKDELKDLNKKDVLLAKFMLDVGRKTKETEFRQAMLYDIVSIHILDRKNALAKLDERAAILAGHRVKLKEKRNVDREFLKDYLPSISWIKAIETKEGKYISFEGNGRLEAFKKIFSEEDNLSVEIEVYKFRAQKKMLKRANRIRKYNGLTGV